MKLLSVKAIGGLVDAAIAHTQAGDAMIHAAAIQCMMHAAKIGPDGKPVGDVTLADRLVKGLGKSVRVEGLKLWFHDFSPIRWNGDGKVGQIKADKSDYRPYNIEMANANPFYEYAPAAERTARPLKFETLLKLVNGLGERVTKAATEDKFEGNVTEAAAFSEAMAKFAAEWVQSNANKAQEPETVAQRAPRRRAVVAA